MSATGPGPNFLAAARRHHLDADLLLSEVSGHSARPANVKQLSGYSAECAIKFIVQMLGGQLSDGRVSLPGGRKMGHLDNGIFNEVWMYVNSGQYSSAIISAFGQSNPFAEWTISDRYTDGLMTTVDEAKVTLAGARSMLACIETILVDGVR